MEKNLRLLVIKDESIKLTNMEHNLLKFINEQPEFFVSNNIAAIGEKASISTTAITRFARIIGFTSFKNLQLHVYEKFQFYKTNYFLTEGEGWESTIKNVKSSNIYSIYETIDNLNIEKLEKFVNEIITANRIFIYGIGSSHLGCQELSNKLSAMGKNVVINQDFHMQLLNLAALKSDDHVVLFSDTLNTKEIHHLINKTYAYKIPITLITRSQYGVFDKKLTNKINYITREENDNFSTVSAKICQLIIVDIICIQLKASLKCNEQLTELEGPNPITEWNRM